MRSQVGVGFLNCLTRVESLQAARQDWRVGKRLSVAAANQQSNTLPRRVGITALVSPLDRVFRSRGPAKELPRSVQEQRATSRLRREQSRGARC